MRPTLKLAGLCATLAACGGGGGGEGPETRTDAAPPALDLGAAPSDAAPAVDRGPSSPDAGGGAVDAEPGTPDALGPDARPEPTPWLGDADVATGEPALDETELSAALAAVLTATIYNDFDQVHAAYQTMVALADESCPTFAEYPAPEGGVLRRWENDCTTAGGVRFVGSASLRTANGEPNPEGRATYGFVLEVGNGIEISAPDGRVLELAGYISSLRSEGPEWLDRGLYVGGRFRAQGGLEGDDPWLTGTLSGQLGLYNGRSPDGNYMTVSTTSTLANPTPELTGALLDGVESWPDAHCPLEPRGDVALRDAEGTWYSIVFDANPAADEDPLPDPSLCDGCGAVWVRGAQRGRACLTEAQMADFRSW